MSLYYKQHIFVCTNKRPDGHERGCCIDRGGAAVRDHLKKRCAELGIESVRVNAAGCLDRCEHGPVVVVYPQGDWYRISNVEEAELLVGSLAGQADASSLMLSHS
jgi:(2Fe-2S) ferredoxin